MQRIYVIETFYRGEWEARAGYAEKAHALHECEEGRREGGRWRVVTYEPKVRR